LYFVLFLYKGKNSDVGDSGDAPASILGPGKIMLLVCCYCSLIVVAIGCMWLFVVCWL